MFTVRRSKKDLRIEYLDGPVRTARALPPVKINNYDLILFEHSEMNGDPLMVQKKALHANRTLQGETFWLSMRD
jgi:hypothetical protein